MARVTGPLMSFDASGTVAGAIVFSKWRGRNYVRRHAVPANPRSVAQVAARSIIAFLGSQWASLSGANQATWEPAAESEKISAFNQYIKYNARNWRDQMAPCMAFPPVRVAPAGTVDSIVSVVSGRQVELTLSYTITGADWGVVLCRSLITGFTATPSNAVMIGLASGTDIVMVDGPLAPDTYYYNAFLFSKTGFTGPTNTEESAIVT